MFVLSSVLSAFWNLPERAGVSSGGNPSGLGGGDGGGGSRLGRRRDGGGRFHDGGFWGGGSGGGGGLGEVSHEFSSQGVD